MKARTKKHRTKGTRTAEPATGSERVATVSFGPVPSGKMPAPTHGSTYSLISIDDARRLQEGHEGIKALIDVFNTITDPTLADTVINALQGIALAIQEGEIHALAQPDGPAHWFRKRAGRYTKRTEAADGFVQAVRMALEAVLETPPASAGVGPGEPALFRSPIFAAVLADGVVEWLATVGAHYGLNHYPAKGARKRMIEAVQREASKQAGNVKADAHAFALALLGGWMGDAAKASDALKYARP
jgi:hypothetical protein